jgi:hypothetical protein
MKLVGVRRVSRTSDRNESDWRILRRRVVGKDMAGEILSGWGGGKQMPVWVFSVACKNSVLLVEILIYYTHHVG